MTTRHLCLLRHGEAADAAGSDAARPLTSRGLADAAAAGRWLADAGLRPQAAVVSPALRTLQSWERLSAAWPAPPSPQVDPRLHRNTLDDYLAVLRDTDSEVETLLLVGHNPSVSGLATVLADPGGAGPTGAPDLPADFPPGGLAVLALDGDWSAVGPGVAEVRAFVAPPR